MRTTLDLPDALMREVKVRAAQQDRKIKEVVEELLRVGLGQPIPAADAPKPSARRPVQAQSHPPSRRPSAKRVAAPSTAPPKAQAEPQPTDESVIDSSFPL